MRTVVHVKRLEKGFRLYQSGSLPEQERGQGVSFQEVSGPSSTLARFHFHRGVKAGPSSHPQLQTTFILSGEIRYTIGGRRILARSGDILTIGPNVIHSAEVLEEATLLDFFTPAWPGLERK